MPHVAIPLEFVLFGLMLVGLIVFYNHTLGASLIGLATVTLYKLFVTGFDAGPGVPGLLSHFSHEWVILCNLLLLPMGFALLADHFESSKLPELLQLSRAGPSDTKSVLLRSARSYSKKNGRIYLIAKPRS